MPVPNVRLDFMGAPEPMGPFCISWPCTGKNSSAVMVGTFQNVGTDGYVVWVAELRLRATGDYVNGIPVYEAVQ